MGTPRGQLWLDLGLPFEVVEQLTESRSRLRAEVVVEVPRRAVGVVVRRVAGEVGPPARVALELPLGARRAVDLACGHLVAKEPEAEFTRLRPELAMSERCRAKV